MYIYIYIYTYIYINFGEFASPSAYHFCQSDLPNFWALRLTFGRSQITFQMDSPQTFFCPRSFLRQNIPFFRQILCTRYKNVNKLRII